MKPSIVGRSRLQRSGSSLANKFLDDQLYENQFLLRQFHILWGYKEHIRVLWGINVVQSTYLGSAN